jgi:mRNA interferase MazF
MGMVIERFDIFVVRLDPVAGSETAKTRPCIIVSPNELNRAIATVIIAPMTTTQRGWPTRIEVTFQGKTGEIALDQVRTVDKVRLVKKLGSLDSRTADAVLDALGELFAP